LSQKTNPIKHLFGTHARRLELALKRFVFALELAAARDEIHVRRSGLVRFDILEPSLGDERSSPKARELVREMVDERAQLLHRRRISSCVVGH
jgi:hypothetical protein